MRILMVCLLMGAVIFLAYDVAIGNWDGAFLWMASVCCISWYFVARDLDEQKRRRTSDHRRQ